MTTTFDSTGLTVDRKAEILAALFADLVTAFGANTKQTPQSVWGNFMNLLAEAIADQNEVLEFVGGIFDPNSAVGTSLHRLVRLNGLTVIGKTKSTGTLSLTADVGGGCSVTAGSFVSDPLTDIQVKTLSTVVLLAGQTLPVAAQAVIAGATAIAAGTMTQIDTPILNWASVTNAADFTTGLAQETDAQLRMRRELTVESPGTGNVPAIYGVLAALSATLNQKVYENKGQVIDADGVPPGAVWPIVQGGTDAEIANALFNRVGGGIDTFGSTTVSHPDPVTGESYDVKFTRAEEASLEVWVHIAKDPVLYPVDGDDQAKAAIIKYFAGEFTVDGILFPGFRIGDDVVNGLLYTPVGSIPGVNSIVGIWLKYDGGGYPYGKIDIPIPKDGVATVILADITISTGPPPGG